MKARRICTRVDNLTKKDTKELRSRINETVKGFNEEHEIQEEERQLLQQLPIFFNLEKFTFPMLDIDRPWEDLDYDIEEDLKIAR